MPQPMANPTLPSNFPKQQIPSSGPSLSTTPVPSNGGPVRIKTEPGYEAYQGLPTYGNTEAHQRAAAHLEQKFGANALQQIHQRQAQTAMSTPGGQPQRGPMNIQLPPPMSDQQRHDQAEFKRRQQAQQYQNLQQAQQRPMSNNGQTDGPGDWEDYVTQRRLDASRNPQQINEADLTIRQQVEQANRSMEGGGLMMPLAEQSTLPQTKKHKIATTEMGSGSGQAALVAAQTSDHEYMPQVSQLDGGVDDEDEEDSKAGIKDELFGDDDDEDAINSDLDDPDDNVIEEEQEEGRPAQIMLCTYDKVARVKNKWKCTLKDGVLTTGGKE